LVDEGVAPALAEREAWLAVQEVAR
jgi:hypothetical protein